VNFKAVTRNNGTTTFSFDTVNGVFDSASRKLIPLVAGASNLLTSTTLPSDSLYSGTLSLGQTPLFLSRRPSFRVQKRTPKDVERLG
jgi:hypothetical protein